MTAIVLASFAAAGAGTCVAAAVVTRFDAAVAARLVPSAVSRPGGGTQAETVAVRVGRLQLVRGERKRAALKPRVAAAGWRISPVDLLGRERIAASVALVLFLVLPAPLPMLGPVAVLIAFRLPDVLLSRAERRRRARVDAELPQLLDLLAGASSAGLAAPVAFRRALAAVTGPLVEELGTVVRAVDLGARWREELRRAADRIALPDLRRAVSALTRTETLGSSLSEAMADLARDVRASRRAKASERARTAPVKMLFPLVFLVLPAFLLLTVVPVLLSTVRSIH
ncbi:MAG: type II secretion system F family protein [Actinomycetota bacterium]